MNVMAALRTTPALVLKLDEELMTQKEKVARLKMRARYMQADALEAVSKLMVDGKRAFPNADAREGAARSRLHNDPEWRALQDDIDAGENLCGKIEATIRYHQEVQRNARVLALARSPFDLVLEESAP